MTASIRPGRYSRAIIELFEGGRVSTAWHRDRETMRCSARATMCNHVGSRVLYIINAIVPEPDWTPTDHGARWSNYHQAIIPEEPTP